LARAAARKSSLASYRTQPTARRQNTSASPAGFPRCTRRSTGRTCTGLYLSSTPYSSTDFQSVSLSSRSRASSGSWNLSDQLVCGSGRRGIRKVRKSGDICLRRHLLQPSSPKEALTPGRTARVYRGGTLGRRLKPCRRGSCVLERGVCSRDAEPRCVTFYDSGAFRFCLLGFPRT